MVLRPGWFPEYSPAEQLVFDEIKKIIETNYQQYGFSHIQTPAVEANTVLLAKNWEDAGQQIFGLYGLAQWTWDTKDYALHFDLTVPFARYTLDWEADIAFPFKRFQVQPVRRGERSQRGRFKEFWQADVDVIWRQDAVGDQNIWSHLYYDAETVVVIAKTLTEISARFLNNKPISLRTNNRYLLAWFFSQFDQKIVPQLYSLLDRFYKISLDVFEKELKELVDDKEAKKIMAFVHSSFSDLSLDLVDNDMYRRWYAELKEMMTYVQWLNKDGIYKIVWDPRIIRGLDYYTGMVYEAFFEDDMGLGSISGWGRYENLCGYINPKKANYSGVGGSIGLSRMVYLILEQNKPEYTTSTEYLFVNFVETQQETLWLMQTFLNDWKIVEYYPVPEKLGKQFTYADKKWIPHVVILGEWELKDNIYKIKNMKTGEEKVVSIK